MQSFDDILLLSWTSFWTILSSDQWIEMLACSRDIIAMQNSNFCSHTINDFLFITYRNMCDIDNTTFLYQPTWNKA